ncbi:MAG: ABC transporter permease subunit [Bacilli bacterium]|nr:ABC transporter permease subunit [Bacilli bacterium]
MNKAESSENKGFFYKWVHREVQVDLSDAQDGSDMRTITKKRPVLLISLGTLGIVVLIASIALLNWGARLNINFPAFGQAIANLFIPNPYRTGDIAGWWAYAWQQFSTSFLQLFYICFLGTAIGSVLSVPIYYLCARNTNRVKWLRTGVRVIFDIIRTLPIFLICFFFSQIFSIGNTINGVLTMAVFTISVKYLMMYQYVETIEMSPFEAIRAAGGRNGQCIMTAIHPYAKPMWISYFIYCLEINIRASVILSYVGFGGYIKILQNNIENNYYDYVGAMLLPLILFVMILQFVSNFLMRRGHK